MMRTLAHDGYEWCVLTSYWECDGCPYAGVVAVKSNCGWIALARVSHDVNTGEVFRELVKSADLTPIDDGRMDGGLKRI